MATGHHLDDTSIITRLVQETDRGLRSVVFFAVGGRSKALVAAFCRNLLEIPEVATVLTGDIVADRLGWILRLWLTELFFFPRDGDFETLIRRQEEVGRRHAAVRVPPAITQKAMTALKREVFRAVLEGATGHPRLHEMIIYVNELLDWAAGIINRSCFNDMMIDVRDEQTLKLQVFGIDMVMQVESLRASLFDWHRQILLRLNEETVARATLPSLRRTSLGLWLVHKGDLLIPDTSDVDQLKFIVEEVETLIGQVAGQRTLVPAAELRQVQDQIGEYINSAASLLSHISDKMLTLDGGRDPLTKLFNRRFLRTILQREIRLSIGSGERFALVMADVDHFKAINDHHGHACGDAVLRQVSELLVSHTRAGDFVFRYGGEEFLVLLTGITPEISHKIAEKLRSIVERASFPLPDGGQLTVTASFGLAIHDGHPDYNRIVGQADTAMYQAKKQGRNRVAMFQGEPTTDPR